MKKHAFLLSVLFLALSGCIGDDIIEDFVEPTIRIATIPDTLEINTSFQFEYTYLNNIGVEEEVDVFWSSSDNQIIEINNSGLATAKALGNAEITVEFSNNGVPLTETINVTVGMETVVQSADKGGSIRTTSSYTLEGNFTLMADGDDLVLEFGEDYVASSNLPGLYVYLTNNPSTTNNALEIGAVEIFEGAHSYRIDGVDINEYSFLLYFCKPFNVKVGDGNIE